MFNSDNAFSKKVLDTLMKQKIKAEDDLKLIEQKMKVCEGEFKTKEERIKSLEDEMGQKIEYIKKVEGQLG